MRLINPNDSNTAPNPNYRPHGTKVRDLLSPESMRNIGRAFDRKIVKA